MKREDTIVRDFKSFVEIMATTGNTKVMERSKTGKMDTTKARL